MSASIKDDEGHRVSLRRWQHGIVVENRLGWVRLTPANARKLGLALLSITNTNAPKESQ